VAERHGITPTEIMLRVMRGGDAELTKWFVEEDRKAIAERRQRARRATEEEPA
jgi:hypothetical protein